MLLLLKLLLVPALIATVTLATRRWGPRIGGLLTALPVVGGPTLCFYAVEQGDLFAAQAAHSTLVGLVAVVAFCVAYSHCSRRTEWPISLLTGWLGFAAVTVVIYALQPNVILGLLFVLASIALGQRALPAHFPESKAAKNSAWDLPLRMLASGALVLALTSLAGWLGPNLSGLLTPFPVATAIFAIFTHTEGGPNAVATYFSGFLQAFYSFAMFCFVLAVGLASLGLPLALALALFVQLGMQGLVLWRMTRSPELSAKRHEVR